MDDIYQVILEDTLAGYWDWNIPEHTEYLSPTFKAMFGYEDHELENKPETWQEIIFPEDLEKVFANFDEHVASKGKVPYRNEVRYRHKNGSVVWVLCTGRVIEWNGEKPVRMVGCHIDITKRKEAEEQLIYTQNFLNKTAQTAKIGPWEVDLVKNKVTWSEVTRTIHEVDADFEPSVEGGLKFYKRGESRKKVTEVFTNLVNTGEPFDIECVLVTDKKNEIWVRVIGQAEMQGEQCIKAYGTIQDIDAQKKVKDELLQSEHRFRESFENSAIGMALVSLEGKWLKVNKQICDIVGYTEEELLKKTFQEITHPDDLDADLDHVQELLEGKIESYSMEKRYFNRVGDIVWVMLNVSLVRSVDGKPVHFVSQIEDITRRKDAEEKLKIANDELNRLFEALTHVTVIATDLEGIITHFSSGAEKLLGYNASEVIGKATPAIVHKESEVVARQKELSEQFGKKVEGFDVFVELAKQGKYESREWTYVRKDGSAFPVQLVVTSIRDDQGNIIGFIGIATDISKLKQKEKELKQTIDVVSEQNTRLYNFAHIVSHNLRSHTGNLSLLLELYQNAESGNEKTEMFDHLLAVSNNLNDTIAHLNEVVTIQTNIDQQRTEVNLFEYAEKAIETLSGDISHAGVIVKNNIDKNASVNYNEAYMDSIMLNLISNAIKYRSKEREPVVELDFNISSKEAILSVRDNGIGIDLEKHGDKLFGMYKTFHNNEDAKGIGLFITKSQIEAMGGKIDVQSELNKGTQFNIYL